MIEALEKQVLLRGPLVWDPNKEHNGPDPEIQRTEQQFREVFSPYIGQVVLVQGLDNNCRLATRYPANAKLFILQHGIIEFAERRKRDRGGNFFLGFSDEDTAAIDGYGWAGYNRILDFVGSEIARVVGSKGETIYEDPTEIRRWEQFYGKWKNNGQLPSKYRNETFGSLADFSSTQILNRVIQKALSESLLTAYRVRPE